MSTLAILRLLTLLTVALPAAGFCAIACRMVLRRRPSEQLTAAIIGTTFSLATLCVAAALAIMMQQDIPRVSVDLGAWFSVGHYQFESALVLDRLSLPFALFGAAITGLIGAFSRRYLHREAGYQRFYLLLALFGSSFLLVVLSRRLDLLFVGWELVGLTSTLLIAFFHERKAPVAHALRAFLTYRFSDMGLLAALIWSHHTTASDPHLADGALWASWPVPADPEHALVFGLLLVWATMGKSALVPMSGWLPRAMEGPTPSSAIFYGALSIHLGPYLLLRSATLLEAVPAIAWLVVALGAVTALHANLVGRVQTDIKSAYAYASMMQIGLIFVEIGCGLYVLAMVHIVGHATLRSLELLRAPSLLHDHHHLERAIGQHLPRLGLHFERLIPAAWQRWLYRFALERSYLDGLLVDRLIVPLRRLLRTVDGIETRWVHWLGGTSTGMPLHRREERGTHAAADVAR